MRPFDFFTTSITDPLPLALVSTSLPPCLPAKQYLSHVRHSTKLEIVKLTVCLSMWW